MKARLRSRAWVLVIATGLWAWPVVAQDTIPPPYVIPGIPDHPPYYVPTPREPVVLPPQDVRYYTRVPGEGCQVGPKIKQQLQKQPVHRWCCWSNHNEYACGSWKSECTFLFGSCRRFFGETCRKAPPWWYGLGQGENTVPNPGDGPLGGPGAGCGGP